jgi:tetratricopeptide (TPR) repeat protein
MRSGRFLVGFAAAALFAASVPDPAGAAASVTPAKSASARATVLFIPFMSKSPVEYAWIGHAAAESIAAHAAASNAVSVVPISAFNGWLRKRDLTADAVRDGQGAIDAAHALGADLVISGSVQASWPDVDVSAWILDVRDEKRKKHADQTGHLEHIVDILDAVATHLFKAQGWPAPKAGAIGTVNAYAFRQGMLGIEILSLQTFGPLQKSILPQGSLKKAKLHCDNAIHLEKRWGAAIGCAAAAEALLGGYDRAIELAELAKGAQGFSPLAPLAAYFARFHKGEKDQALTAVRAAAEAHPGYLAYLACAGEHAQAVEDHALAKRMFDRYLELSPDNPYALVKLGKSLARLGDGEQALAVTTKALERSSKDVNILVELGSREIDLQKLAEAEATLQQALAMDKREARAYLRLGYLYLLQKKPDKAIGILEQSIAQANLDEEWRVKALAHYDLARAHAQAKANDDAFRDLDRAIAGGFEDKSTLEKESDFEALKSDPRWSELVAKLR